MPRSVSPPISPKTIRNPKRSRTSPKDELSVEELNYDDNGYDADVEVLRPDQYEEPESDFEEASSLKGLIPDVDDEITRGMKQLGWRQAPRRVRPVPSHGIEHNSDDIGSSPLNLYGKRAEIDVAEMGAEHIEAPPAKRRKKKGSRLSIAQRVLKEMSQPQTDSSDRTEGKHTPFADTSTGSTAASETPAIASTDEMVLD